MRRFGGIAARELDIEPFRQLQQSPQKLVHPLLRELRRQGERKECSHRFAAHCGDIAQSPREAAMTHGFGRVPLLAEMDALKAEISCDEDFVIFRDAQNRGVVSDSDYDREILPTL